MLGGGVGGTGPAAPPAPQSFVRAGRGLSVLGDGETEARSRDSGKGHARGCSPAPCRRYPSGDPPHSRHIPLSPPLPQFPPSHAGNMHGDRPLCSATAVNGSLFVTPLLPCPPPRRAPSSPCPPLPAAFSFPAQSLAFMAPEAPVTLRPLAVTTQAGDGDTGPPARGFRRPRQRHGPPGPQTPPGAGGFSGGR